MTRITLIEVSARDGLQNEKTILSAAQKIDFINRLSDCGFTHIEAGSFVRPDRIPQLADSEQVFAGIDKKPGVIYSCLVPNMHGMQRAMAAQVKTIAVFVAASEAFSQANLQCSIAESFSRLMPVADMARAQGIAMRGYVSCVLGCPYGPTPSPMQVWEVAEKLFALGCTEVSLGDTIGAGTPDTMRDLLRAKPMAVDAQHLALHCHDTNGQAIANIRIGIAEFGITRIDAALGGVGGCPYAPGAKGNVDTLAVLAMAEEMGLSHGVDIAKAQEAARFIQGLLG
jgi:hydroxymethylglutaryl-CoA lyase